MQNPTSTRKVTATRHQSNVNNTFHKRKDYKAWFADSNSVIAYSSRKLFNDNKPKEKIFVGSCSSALDSPENKGPYGWGMQPLS